MQGKGKREGNTSTTAFGHKSDEMGPAIQHSHITTFSQESLKPSIGCFHYNTISTYWIALGSGLELVTAWLVSWNLTPKLQPQGKKTRGKGDNSYTTGDHIPHEYIITTIFRFSVAGSWQYHHKETLPWRLWRTLSQKLGIKAIEPQEEEDYSVADSLPRW